MDDRPVVLESSNYGSEEAQREDFTVRKHLEYSMEGAVNVCNLAGGENRYVLLMLLQ